VPGGAPLGDFFLAVNAGPAQHEIWDASSFPFSIVNAGDHLDSWNDWSFTLGEAIASLSAGPLQPERFELYPPYPNPFNPSTTLSFSLPGKSNVALKVYNASGRLVETLIDGSMGAGVHTVTWNAAPLASGIYFFRLNAGGRIAAQRGVFAK
jgi:hypothetical protein